MTYPPGTILRPDAAALSAAAALLRAGGLVGLPTETVYGLAADATNGEAVARIYEAKGRPRFNPLISHVADAAAAEAHGVFNADARRLAEAFWPGPLTLVLPLRPGSAISDLALAGLDTVALRVPAHAVATELIRAAGRPLAAPSANLSGRLSPTTAADVAADLGARVGLVLDGGPAAVGVESTVVACLPDGPAVLRPGGVSRRELEERLGRPLARPADSGTLRSPGMLASHYAPNAKVQMNVMRPAANDAVLSFGLRKLVPEVAGQHVINLSSEGDLRQAAARLFAALRELDAQNPSVISVMPIPMEGLGEAINDRLARAAATRDPV